MKLLKFWKPAIWLVIISYLSLMPAGNFPRFPLFNIPGFDKLVHAGFYFVLCILLVKPFRKTTKYPYVLSVVCAIAISSVMEILQIIVTLTRKGDMVDLMANIIGAIAGLIFFRMVISGKPAEKYL
jgi:VanZ family protein